MTNFVKKSEIKNYWYLIDGNNAVVGRLATIIAKIIRGKHKTTFTPHMDDGDFVVVKNVRSEERRVGKECRSRWSPYH